MNNTEPEMPIKSLNSETPRSVSDFFLDYSLPYYSNFVSLNRQGKNRRSKSEENLV